jgi:hypothetical protein
MASVYAGLEIKFFLAGKISLKDSLRRELILNPMGKKISGFRTEQPVPFQAA